MKKHVPMNIDQFTDLLLNLKIGETVFFALGSTTPPDSKMISAYDLFNWMFAKRINIYEGDTTVTVVDACGGEDAYTFNTLEYNVLPDENSEYYRRKIRDEAEYLFFDKWNLKGDDKYDPCVFVEMEAV